MADFLNIEVIEASDAASFNLKDLTTVAEWTTGAASVVPTSSVSRVTSAIIALSGVSGTANIIRSGGLTKLVTFAAGGTTDLTQTATDFVISHATAYLAEGIGLSSTFAAIIMASATIGPSFEIPTINNVTTDLAGTVIPVLESVGGFKVTLTTSGGTAYTYTSFDRDDWTDGIASVNGLDISVSDFTPALTTLADDRYTIKLEVSDDTIAPFTGVHEGSITGYFTMVVKNKIITAIKNLDWKSLTCNTCGCNSYPFSWKLKDMYDSLGYSAELELNTNFDSILTDLETLANDCIDNITGGEDCGCS